MHKNKITDFDNEIIVLDVNLYCLDFNFWQRDCCMLLFIINVQHIFIKYTYMYI